MFEEPHRWIQSVENRIQYIEGRLRRASPAVGLPYRDGALLFTVAPLGQQKIYEVYDRLALAGLGHPADVERLRMMAIDLAHTEGFIRSAEDVTLQRLLNFGIAPQIKSAFDEIWRAPFIVKMLMVELHRSKPLFFTLNYDGNFISRSHYGVAAGAQQAEEVMERLIMKSPPASDSLEDTLRCAARIWAAGYHAAVKEPDYEEPPTPTEANMNEALDEARKKYRFEAATLDATLPGKAKFRRLNSDFLASIL